MTSESANLTKRHFRRSAGAALSALIVVMTGTGTPTAVAQTKPAMGTIPPGATDWGGGFFTGVDSATTQGFAQIGNDPNAKAAATVAVSLPVTRQMPPQKCGDLAALATAYAKDSGSRRRFIEIPEAPTNILRADVLPAERDIPEICRVLGVVAPDIQFEMRLPTKNWNGRFMHYGCGGACGLVYHDQADEPLARGYAVIASDLGHSGAPNSALYNYANIQAVIDFSYRATHVVTLVGKEIVDEYYGRKPNKSYYQGCSTGGVQGAIEVQRYPYDFDGVVITAPAYSTGPSFLAWGAHANLDKNGKSILDPDKLPMVRRAVIAACDGLDGTKDGLLQNPMLCKFDPHTLECKPGADPKGCLSSAEADVVGKIYAGPTNAKGESLSTGYAGMLPGSEYGWSPSFVAKQGEAATRLADPLTSYGDGVYPRVGANAAKTYDYDVDPYRGPSTLSWLRYAGNPDLRMFRRAGGKVILTHGWDDNEVAAGASVDWYETATKTMGGKAEMDKFFKLYMIPGMGHCRRGPGGDTIDLLTAIEGWVEKNETPEMLVVNHMTQEQNYLGLPRLRHPLAKGSVDRTRPIYPYPAIVKYSGRGDINKAESWVKAP